MSKFGLANMETSRRIPGRTADHAHNRNLITGDKKGDTPDNISLVIIPKIKTSPTAKSELVMRISYVLNAILRASSYLMFLLISSSSSECYTPVIVRK
jgi:hypothetical protein